jgi:hypothetical protein
MTSPSPPRPTDPLVESIAGAWRPRDPRGGVRFHPGWYDLDESARLEAFEAARANRLLEAALDPRGLSTTAKAVIARVRAASGE